MNSVAIGIFTTNELLRDKANILAKNLRLPLANDPKNYHYLLELTDHGIVLKKVHSKLSICVDFMSKSLTYRRKNANFKNELLVKALGLKKNSQAFILDATAGLAQDSFILASLGFNITLLERSPIIYTLIDDGLKRGLHHEEIEPIINRMRLCNEDALSWMQNHLKRPHLIYLDPMYPLRKKTALVKKEMQLLQDILGTDTDAEELLNKALACAADRVVVKRPRLAESIKGPIPSFSLQGRSSRFDVYLIRE